MGWQRHIGVYLLVAVASLVAVGYWRLAVRQPSHSVMLVRRPQGVMGTECVLAVVVKNDETRSAVQALQQAEQMLRTVEVLMSNYLVDSEVSRLCQARAGEPVSLSAETLEVLRAARHAWQATQGTFDVTCRPQLKLWQQASDSDQMPVASARQQASQQSNWALFQLRQDSAVKRSDDAAIDLGGIAKGYAIDQALDILRNAGALGAMVDIGGDLACFGQQANGQPWQIDVQRPASDGAITRIRGGDLAVATSGDYARYYSIGAQRFSQVLDPRTCWPATAARAATVVAPDAMTADVWATALSVLGSSGLEQLPDGTEALLIVADQQPARCVCTLGFAALLDQTVPADWEIYQPAAHHRKPQLISVSAMSLSAPTPSSLDIPCSIFDIPFRLWPACRMPGLEGRPHLAPGQAMRAPASVDAARGGGTPPTTAERCGTRHSDSLPRPHPTDRSLVDPGVSAPVPPRPPS